MKTFPTSYQSGPHVFASYVRAPSLPVALKRLRLRGLGEKIDGRSPGDKRSRCSALDLFGRGKYVECIHWLCFAGNVLCNAGLWTQEGLLDDSGVIHMMVHQASHSKRNRKLYKGYIKGEREVLLILLEEFDRRTGKLGY